MGYLLNPRTYACITGVGVGSGALGGGGGGGGNMGSMGLNAGALGACGYGEMKKWTSSTLCTHTPSSRMCEGCD